MTHVIFDPCIRDGACADVCPVNCIAAGEPETDWPWYYIDPDNCIDCGDCVDACPVDAICPAERLPAPFAAALGLNARYFRAGPGAAARR